MLTENLRKYLPLVMSDKHDLKTVSPETPFLSSDEDRENSLSGYEESKGSRYERSWCKRHRSAILFHSLMMLFYLSLTVTFWRNLTSHKNLLFSKRQRYSVSVMLPYWTVS